MVGALTYYIVRNFQNPRSTLWVPFLCLHQLHMFQIHSPPTPSVGATSLLNPFLHLRRRRRKLTVLPDPRTKLIKHDGNRHQNQGHAAQQRAGPVDADALEHVGCEEGEDGAGEGAQEGVRCNC